MTFLIDAGGDAGAGLADIETGAAAFEALGADAMVVSETRHDAFVAAALAARATSRMQIFTGIAVALARNPMTVAYAANDLQELSGGRFVLGLGSQVQAHIEKRFSMPWSQPAARMAEFIGAVREIWAAWASGERPRHRGEHYTHTLMTPFFDPGPNPHGSPEVWLAAVGERMTATAGAVADGLIAHPFTTPRYLAEVTLPALARGAAEAGRSTPGVALQAFVAMGRDEAEIRQAALATARQIAFYGSTPTYLPVLELHGWGAKQEELNDAIRRGDWGALGGILTEEMVREFAAVGTPEQVAAQLTARYGDAVSRLGFYTPYEVAPELWSALYAALRG